MGARCAGPSARRSHAQPSFEVSLQTEKKKKNHFKHVLYKQVKLFRRWFCEPLKIAEEFINKIKIKKSPKPKRRKSKKKSFCGKQGCLELCELVRSTTSECPQSDVTSRLLRGHSKWHALLKVEQLIFGRLFRCFRYIQENEKLNGLYGFKL